jgi:hypothetical protein
LRRLAGLGHRRHRPFDLTHPGGPYASTIRPLSGDAASATTGEQPVISGLPGLPVPADGGDAARSRLLVAFRPGAGKLGAPVPV